jgi:uncharacterized iron-regulated protein
MHSLHFFAPTNQMLLDSFLKKNLKLVIQKTNNFVENEDYQPMLQPWASIKAPVLGRILKQVVRINVIQCIDVPYGI